MMPPYAIGHDHVGVKKPLRQRFVFLKADKTLVMRIEVTTIDIRRIVPIPLEAAQNCLIAGNVGPFFHTGIKPHQQMNTFSHLAKIHVPCIIQRVVSAKIDSAFVRHLSDKGGGKHSGVHTEVAKTGILRLSIVML